LEKSPGDEAACRRIVLSYQASPGDSGAAELFRLGGDWEETVPAAALDAYEAAMGIAYAADPPLAETALVRWASLLGRSNGVSIMDLDRLPADWSSPAVTGLRDWLQQPEAPPESWWRSGAWRSSALAGTSLALGRERLNRGEPAKAEAVWVVGRELAGSSTGVYTDLQTELALLYFRHPELDPGGRKFLDTENRLYNEKLTAIVRHDLAASQRFHATLGLIYAERGIWESAIRGRGALFQLEDALSDAAERDRDEGTFQPLPWLRERLADGYRALSRKKKAAAVYLEAARAYLDMDDLGKAAKMIDAARGLSQPSWDAVAEAGRLAAILDTRRRLAEAAEQPDGKMSKRALEGLAGSAWLAPSWSHSDPKFLDRQRFKALADLSAVEERSAAPAPALSHGSQALDMALERRVFLSGAGDLLRLQRLQALSAAAVGMSPPPPEPRVVAQRDAGDTLPLALPSGGSPARVRVSPEGALANRIVLSMGAEIVLAARLELHIQGGQVVLREVRPGTDTVRLMRIIEETGGVNRVVREPPE
jgi:hypothetical protein